MGRQALGKGFDALIPRGEEDKVSLDRIFHSPLQPREKIDDEDLEGLVKSIKQNGVLQPVLLRRVEEDKFELVYGHRRFEAAKRANLDEIPAVVRQLTDREVLEIAVIENVQREDLNPIEEARSYKKLNTEFDLTQEEIAERVGKARTTVTNKLRLLSLPDEVKEALMEGKITEGHARALLSLKDRKKILRELENILSSKKTVRDVEDTGKSRKRKKKELPAKYRDLREELIHIFNTDVKISLGKKKNRLTIEFYSDEDLDRIYRLIKGEKEG